MHYIFVINDIDFGDLIITAQEIADKLLNKNQWLFTQFTPHIKRIKAGDKIVLYFAGKNRRYFTASFEIAGSIVEHQMHASDNKEEILFQIYNLATPVRNIETWEPPLPISELKDRLSFITDKKNWGLFFRQSTKLISKEDFDLITSAKRLAGV